jgi:hypothetical protein
MAHGMPMLLHCLHVNNSDAVNLKVAVTVGKSAVLTICFRLDQHLILFTGIYAYMCSGSFCGVEVHM